MSKRRIQNERDWKSWDDLDGNRRRYWRKRKGRRWGHQILFKEVVLNTESNLEDTVRMWQEIYDDREKLVEIHQKFPTDTGHIKI